MAIRVKRVYDPPDRNDGCRVLVDRLWPRGVGKEEGRIDEWCREIAPSDELRKWFGHDPDKWTGFRQRYFAELEQKEELVAELAEKARGGSLTLVFGAKDEKHNNAVALRDYLEKRLRG
ncbi:MAG TPA: DUF488 domain-containing protein [Desulfuromonadales bacterium]|jgi:uncharacterized protein YeaO (DUF488 family)